MKSTVLEEDLDENYEPLPDEINEYARFLGMDPTEDADLLWIARESLKAPLPENWKPCQTEDGEIYYFNFKTGESLWDHPCDAHYKDLYLREKDKKKAKEPEFLKLKKSSSKELQSKKLDLISSRPLKPLQITSKTNQLSPLLSPIKKSSSNLLGSSPTVNSIDLETDKKIAGLIKLKPNSSMSLLSPINKVDLESVEKETEADFTIKVQALKSQYALKLENEVVAQEKTLKERLEFLEKEGMDKMTGLKAKLEKELDNVSKNNSRQLNELKNSHEQVINALKSKQEIELRELKESFDALVKSEKLKMDNHRLRVNEQEAQLELQDSYKDKLKNAESSLQSEMDSKLLIVEKELSAKLAQETSRLEQEYQEKIEKERQKLQDAFKEEQGNIQAQIESKLEKRINNNITTSNPEDIHSTEQEPNNDENYDKFLLEKKWTLYQSGLTSENINSRLDFHQELSRRVKEEDLFISQLKENRVQENQNNQKHLPQSDADTKRYSREASLSAIEINEYKLRQYLGQVSKKNHFEKGLLSRHIIPTQIQKKTEWISENSRYASACKEHQAFLEKKIY